MIEIEIIHPGLLTSIQDDGRRGVAFYAIPRSGHLDPAAAYEANRLVGNAPSAPVLECNLLAPQLRVLDDTTLCVTGADMAWTLNDQLIARNTAIHAATGNELKGSYATDGARAYVAFAGAMECRRDHDSAATYTYAGLGGLDGRALETGDVIRVAPHTTPVSLQTAEAPRHYDEETTIRFIEGPEWHLLTRESRQRVEAVEYSISTDSNRMGARLDGPSLALRSEIDMDTVPLLPGTIQLTGAGKPIVILVDGQTTGGYPRIAIILRSELSRFNQIRPGTGFRFVK